MHREKEHNEEIISLSRVKPQKSIFNTLVSEKNKILRL